MFGSRTRLTALTLLLASSTVAGGQEVPSAPPTPTVWRFLGIPQGLQKIRDVSVNRRGNFPGLERKPPLKRIADPANLESDNPAIKAAAEIKQAEDMKAQKIKAIKYLASIGCGCYDKDGKITDALLAATDDCTPDVRLAAIEAVEEAAGNESCRKCGSTSCCNEKLTKRLSEMAYERDDSGCPLEPNAEVREAAARALRVCCPGGPPTGPIEEEVPTPPADEGVRGEQIEDESGVTGEAVEEATDATEDVEADGEAAGGGRMEELPPGELGELQLFRTSQHDPAQTSQPEPGDIELGDVQTIAGMKIQPVTLKPVTFEDSAAAENPQAAEPVAAAPSAMASQSAAEESSRQEVTPVAAPIARVKRAAEIVSVDHRTGRVRLRVHGRQPLPVGASGVVYHEYLTGERLVSHLIVRSVQGGYADATVTDRSTLKLVHAGDRVVCH